MQREAKKVPQKLQVNFPRPPEENDMTDWQMWEKECGSARRLAAKEKEKVTKTLKQKSNAVQRQRIQQMYPTKQKQMDKTFFVEMTQTRNSS